MPAPTLRVVVCQCSTSTIPRRAPKWRVHLEVKAGGVEYSLTTKPLAKWIDADMTADHLRKSLELHGVEKCLKLQKT